MVWSVTDPRDGKRVALKKLPNVFQSLVSSKRVFRELKMMRFFKHENVLSCLDILQVRIPLLYTFTITNIGDDKKQTNFHLVIILIYCSLLTSTSFKKST